MILLVFGHVSWIVHHASYFMFYADFFILKEVLL